MLNHCLCLITVQRDKNFSLNWLIRSPSKALLKLEKVHKTLETADTKSLLVSFFDIVWQTF